MDHPSNREMECTYALILIIYEQLVVNQLKKGLDIVNDDLLMLPPRVTGVDPSLAMVEEARFLSLRSILTMRIIMMKIMLKKLKSLQCVWSVNGMRTMSFQWSGNLSLSLGFNSRQAGRRTFHRQTTRHRYIGTTGTGT